MAVKTVANTVGTGAVEWVWRKKLFNLRLDATKRRMKSPVYKPNWAERMQAKRINRVVAMINR